MGIDIIIKMRISKGDWMKVSAVENDREKRWSIVIDDKKESVRNVRFLAFRRTAPSWRRTTLD